MPSPHRASVALAIAVVVTLAAVLIDSLHRVSAYQSQIASERPAGPTVDFIALNTDGSPVTDLQSSEVEVRIAERVRAVRTLRRVSAAPSPIAAGAPRVPPPYGTNDDVAAGRRFMFVIDQESFVAGREQLFRNAIEGLLAQLTPADRTMVAALPFGGVMVPFTSDIARIRLAAGRVTGQGSRVETGSDLACRTRRFLESLEGLLRTQATQASPQTLIVFTAGLAGPRRDAPMGILPGMCELVVDLFRHVGTAASAARANVYVMQPADIGIGASLPRPTRGRRRRHRLRQPARGYRAPRRRHRRGAPSARRDRHGIAAPGREGKLRPITSLSSNPCAAKSSGAAVPLECESRAAASSSAHVRKSRSQTRRSPDRRVSS